MWARQLSNSILLTAAHVKRHFCNNNCVPSTCWYQTYVGWLCVCVCVCVCARVFALEMLCLRCSSGVCWCLLNDLAAGNRLSGWEGGYHVNYFTHTLPAKRATQLLSSHTHARTHTYTQTHTHTHTHATGYIHTKTCRLSFLLSFFCLPIPLVWRPWTSIPFCFQERLFYILINSTLSCEINWHSLNDF